MNCLPFILVLIAVLGLSHSAAYYSTCARMDAGAALRKVAQGLCIASCRAQRCGTGSCQKRSGRKTCVCSRCR